MDKIRLLLIEDNRDTMVVFKKMLRDDYEITACNNATEAEKEILNTSYDLILTDINLGYGASGQDLGEMAKVSKANASTPVVGITAYVESSKYIDKSKFAGFIVKPITQIELLEGLEKVLRDDI